MSGRRPRPGPSAGSPVLAVRDLAVAYGGARVLQGVTMEVDSGWVVAVVGANGAGKTTLLRAVSGLLGFHGGTIVGGTVELDGQVLATSAKVGAIGGGAAAMVHRGVAHVMEGGRVFPGLTVDENLQAGALGRGNRAAAAGARERVLGLFPTLVPLCRTPAGRLSGGERQMVALGRALMSSPRLLLLDEPFLGLAPQLVELVQEFLLHINAAGTTIVLAEQSADAALAVAHRAYVLADGTVAASGVARDLAGRDMGRLYLPRPGPTDHPIGRTTPPPEPPLAADLRVAVQPVDVEPVDAEPVDVEPVDVEPAAAQSAGAQPVAAQPVAARADAARPAAPRPRLLELSDVTLRFGPVVALDGLTMGVAEGEIVAVVGPNGAGKTSVLNCVNQLYRPSAGRVRLAGVDLVGRQPWEVAGLGVARSFQRPVLLARLDVVDNLLVGRHRLMANGLLANAFRLRRSRREEAGHRRRCHEIVDLLELGPYRTRPAGELPFGIQKVVELGRALAMEARLILLDEPSAGMSQAETDHLTRCVLGLRADRGMAVLLVEHRVGLVGRLADRVVVLDSGRLMADGPTVDVLADPMVAQVYLGRSTTAGPAAAAPVHPEAATR
ncbi:MAG TPA: ATP-binding cassette domain-containing protein [Acidimicrobiales bacterium]|nr:ATP-binding cassette domain-containing protein [Acidimicrobiales bacterium]